MLMLAGGVAEEAEAGGEGISVVGGDVPAREVEGAHGARPAAAMTARGSGDGRAGGVWVAKPRWSEVFVEGQVGWLAVIGGDQRG